MTKQRTITLTIDGGLEGQHAYADLAHALWSVAKLVPQAEVTLEADESAPASEMNSRWAELGRDVPWTHA